MRTSSRHTPFLQTAEQQDLLTALESAGPGDARTRRMPRPVHVAERQRAGFAAALALVVEFGKRAEEEKDVPRRTRCPACGCVGDTYRDFGVRRMGDGQVRAQSWCRTCRSAKAHRAHEARPARVPQADLLFAG